MKITTEGVVNFILVALDIIGAVAVVLKLFHVIGWPWLWVLSFWWIPLVLVLMSIIYLNVISYVSDEKHP